MRTPDEILPEIISEALALDIPISSRISRGVKISKRSVNTLGLCRKTGSGIFEIQLSERTVKGGEEAVRSVLAHEVLHTCRGCQNHGATWKKYALKMENAYGYKIARTIEPESVGIEKASPKYVVRCAKCGKEFGRQRECKLTKYPWLYRCRCGGALKLMYSPNIQK